MTALRNTNVPIPKTRLFCDDKEIIGSPFFVYGRPSFPTILRSFVDFVEGKFFKDATLAAITQPELRKSMYFHLLDSLAKIHSVDVDGLNFLIGNHNHIY